MACEFAGNVRAGLQVKACECGKDKVCTMLGLRLRPGSCISATLGVHILVVLTGRGTENTRMRGMTRAQPRVSEWQQITDDVGGVTGDIEKCGCRKVNEPDLRSE